MVLGWFKPLTKPCLGMLMQIMSVVGKSTHVQLIEQKGLYAAMFNAQRNSYG